MKTTPRQEDRCSFPSGADFRRYEVKQDPQERSSPILRVAKTPCALPVALLSVIQA